MAKFKIINTDTKIECQKWEMKEALEAIPNLLDAVETSEFLSHILDTLTQKQLNDILNFTCERFPSQASLRLEECGLIQEG